ncbi:hypothetical protein [Thermofilum pendens]
MAVGAGVRAVLAASVAVVAVVLAVAVLAVAFFEVYSRYPPVALLVLASAVAVVRGRGTSFYVVVGAALLLVAVIIAGSVVRPLVPVMC